MTCRVWGTWSTRSGPVAPRDHPQTKARGQSESARGDYQDPYGEDEVRAKFRELARVVLSAAAVARVEALVDRLDDLPRLGDLVAALRASV